ncbi:MAG TPA: MGMT family protein [Candidatus Pullichristensenella avicola]|nr:MGMT family protein [Candidatus Pullichristensenella avicola]
MNDFYRQVYDLVAQIPPGRVISYGQIARLLCRPHAAREVGRAMRLCPEHLPWQRVVMRDGSIAAGGDPALRRRLLETEGAAFLPDGRVDMDACRWP